MGLLSQIENDSTPTEKSSATPWRNVALRVAGYDVENRITIGVDISTGETVKVKLDGAARPGRDDVDVWSQKRYRDRKGILEKINPKAVVAGDESEAGTIIFEAVRASNVEGVMEARWATTASHAAQDASVFEVMARPIAERSFPGKPAQVGQVGKSLGIEMVRTVTAAAVTSTSEISEQITDILTRPFTQAVVRAQDEDGKVMSSIVKRPFTDELRTLTGQIKGAEEAARDARKSFADIRNASKAKRAELKEQLAAADAKSIALAAPSFFENDPMGKLLKKLNAEQVSTLKIEVFALEQVYPGDKYKDELGGNRVDGLSFRRDWLIPNKGFGFGSTLVALREHEEGGMQVTKLRPASTRQMLYASLNEISTPNIQPTATPFVARTVQVEEERAPEPAAPAASVASKPAAVQKSEVADPEGVLAGKDIDALSNKLAYASRHRVGAGAR